MHFALPRIIAFFALTLITLSACDNNNTPQGTNPDKPTSYTPGSAYQAAQKRGYLIAGVKYDTNLFGRQDPLDRKVKGFDIDIAKAVAKHIFGDDSKLELKEVTSKTRIPLLQNGDVDIVVATMTITEKRKQIVDFSEVYFEAGQSLLVPNDSPISSVEDLADKSVIAVKGSTSAKNIREKAPQARVSEYENYAEAFTALKAGKGDALTTDNSILLGMRQEDPNFKLTGGLFTHEPYGIAVRKGDAAMLKAINDTLKETHKSGLYDALYQKWFGKLEELKRPQKTEQPQR